jgi:hypothetical protein
MSVSLNPSPALVGIVLLSLGSCAELSELPLQPEPAGSCRLAVLTNTGDWISTETDFTWSVAWGDMDGDGERIGRTRAELEYRRGTPTAVPKFRLVTRLWKRAPHPPQYSRVGGPKNGQVPGQHRVQSSLASRSRSVAHGCP